MFRFSCLRFYINSSCTDVPMGNVSVSALLDKSPADANAPREMHDHPIVFVAKPLRRILYTHYHDRRLMLVSTPDPLGCSALFLPSSSGRCHFSAMR